MILPEYTYRYNYTPNGNSIYKMIDFGYKLNQNFYKQVYLRKSRESFNCLNCNKKYPPKTKKIQQNVCYVCAKLWYENSNAELKKIIGIFETQIKEIDDKKDEWDKEVLISSI